MVRCICRLALEGNGPLQIATALGNMEALNPSAYRTSKGFNKGGSKSTLEPYHRRENPHLVGILRRCNQLQNLYNCIGAFEVPDRRKIPERDILMETRKGVALSYAPTQIAI